MIDSAGLTVDQYLNLLFLQRADFIITLMYVIIAALALIAILQIVSIVRMIRLRASGETDEASPIAVPSVTMQAAAPSLPPLNLNGIPESEAAMVMATLADQLGTPIERLRFVSIERSTAPAIAEQQMTLVGVPEKTAAFIMAIVADKTKIPLGQLRFKSIKRVN